MEEILVLREGDFRSKKKMLEHIADELSFPDYFGQNLDALMDCLSDVDQPVNIALDPDPSMADKAWYRDICEVIYDAAAENRNIRVFTGLTIEEADFWEEDLGEDLEADLGEDIGEGFGGEDFDDDYGMDE